MKPITDYVLSQNGTVVIEELPSWFDFFEKYVLQGEAVSLPCLQPIAVFKKTQAIGNEQILGTRLVPSTLFESSEGRDQIYQALTTLLPSVPHFGMLMTTPFLFNYTEGTTSATPAWRGALWHVRLTPTPVLPSVLTHTKVWGRVAMGIQFHQRRETGCL